MLNNSIIFSFILITITFPFVLSGTTCGVKEVEALTYLGKLNNKLITRLNREQLARFEFNVNVTPENIIKLMDISLDNAKFRKLKAREIEDRGFTFIEDQDISRQIKRLTNLDNLALDDDDYSNLNKALTYMTTNYAEVRVCDYKIKSKCDLLLEPDLEEQFSHSRDTDELKHYWLEWYNKAGTPTKSQFRTYVELTRKAAKLNEFNSLADSWIDKYEDVNFETHLNEIYNQILPLYKNIHAYVRYRLRNKYGENIILDNGNIPMHLLGNLWGQSWTNIMDIVAPYPDKPLFDVTPELIKQDYTPIKIFEKADEFFQSLGMKKLPKIFWEKSVLVKPNDSREIICHASAFDMYINDDVRVKQCTRITMRQFATAHHELGHIQYYLQYREQPITFRTAPNPGFHEAVGDVLSLSVLTPKHLKRIGLLKNYLSDQETRINHLFKMALKKIVFLPFAYTLDKYRWAISRNEINDNQWNCKFWDMRSKFGGIEPPVTRSENDFDPPAKYHVSAGVEYLRYFAAHIFQFQFLRAACIKADQYDPGNVEKSLDNCDIYGSLEAGNSFQEMLALGASKPWPDALEVFTGERNMSAFALLEYFNPLNEWLQNEISEKNIPVGWKSSDKCKL